MASNTNTNAGLPTVPLNKVREDIGLCIAAQLPVILAGDTGIGKSDLMQQVATDMGHTLVVHHPISWDTTRMGGYPTIKDGEAVHIPYGELRLWAQATQPTIAFLDEIGDAPGHVQKTLTHAILLREVNGIRISPEVRFAMATNRRQDASGVQGIPSTVLSRSAVFHVRADLDGWLRRAPGWDIPPEVCFFLRRYPETFSPGTDRRAVSQMLRTPNPRGWSQLCRVGHPDKLSDNLITTIMGESITLAWRAWQRVRESVGDPWECLRNPETAPVPQESDRAIATLLAIVHLVTGDPAGLAEPFAKYLERMLRPEYACFAWINAAERCPDLKRTPEWQRAWSFMNE